MLCGEIIRSPNRSPYATLLSSLYPIMTAAVIEEDNLLENGRSSYENPNYHLSGTRNLALDDALNSNLTSSTDSSAGFNINGECVLYSDLLCRDFESVCNINEDNINRRRYKSLDLGSMGVDIMTTGGTYWNKTMNITNNSPSNNKQDYTNINNQNHQRQKPYVKPDLIEESELIKHKGGNINEKRSPPNTLQLNKKDSSCINNDIQHVQGDLNNDLYAVPMKTKSSDHLKEQLPAGWEKHEDDDGPYYWHIKSGTIQREIPEYSGKNEPKTPLVKDAEYVLNSFQSSGGLVSSVTRSTTSSALENLCYQKNKKEEMAYKRRSYPARIENENKGIRFAVRSLGWVEICEEDLTPERSSKAVNKCIVDLSLGRNDFIDNVGRWGDGKDLFMDLDEGALKLIDPENLTVLNTQPIHTIRVWGVGRDNGRERDFAYVARDRITRQHMCHVFRCDMPARTIANTLRDICKKIMIERSLQQNLSRPTDLSCVTKMNQPIRPTNLPLEYRKRRSYRGSYTSANTIIQPFPTPMEEPRKVIHATYLGSTEVSRPSGMDILNEAIQTLKSSEFTLPQSVTVAVAPSMITIQQENDEEDQVVECRVRYLSFLGIGKDVKQCAFIMHTTQDLFIAHVFECDQSAATLCKTIEAACKLRYQKCLDAHPQGMNPNLSLSHNINNQNLNNISRKGISSTLKSLVGTITGRKMKLTQSEELLNSEVREVIPHRHLQSPHTIKYYALSTSINWISVVGLEIHAQLQSKSKLFSAAGNQFNSSANTQVALFDAAIPGTLPVLNKRCVEAAVLTAMALNCNLNTISLFDRKHYYYADMPAGYQITQQNKPLAVNGELSFYVADENINKEIYSKTSIIKQIQLEQDSGRIINDTYSQTSLVDLNRAGIGLIELVFEPDLCNGLEASSLVKELLLIFECIKTCSCKMEEGALRVDANVSIKNGEQMGIRTEIKNLGSVRAVHLAVDYEIRRQINLIKAGKEIINETRGWDSVSNKTISMRDKEVLQDYRFMPEPNLLPLNLNVIDLNKLKSSIPELPKVTRIRLMEKHGLNLRKAYILMNQPVLLSLFFEIMNENPSRNSSRVWNILTIEFLAELNKVNLAPSQCKLSFSSIGEVIDLLENETLNLDYARKVIEKLIMNTNLSPLKIVMENNWRQITNENEIIELCKEAMLDLPKAVKDYRKGKIQAIKALIGSIAKKTNKRANLALVSKKLEEFLNNNK
ncbi:uncharacterized protein LOC126893759 [Daktulosphaira vitifoliae]|uniref:uncharacterized protein LOC126893759 n=1 Tax=Daktulosphaira vitifoliae TaxID=58002 RepID=UPI0021AAAB71|nr:uncharacterized protein LOC126893759 [Daktulosphaira vitifoliae]